MRAQAKKGGDGEAHAARGGNRRRRQSKDSARHSFGTQSPALASRPSSRHNLGAICLQAPDVDEEQGADEHAEAAETTRNLSAGADQEADLLALVARRQRRRQRVLPTSRTSGTGAAVGGADGGSPDVQRNFRHFQKARNGSRVGQVSTLQTTAQSSQSRRSGGERVDLTPSSFLAERFDFDGGR